MKERTIGSTASGASVRRHRGNHTGGSSMPTSDAPAPPPGELDRWEAEAAAFYEATGYLRPGKDVPAAMGATSDYESRREVAWELWCGGRKYERGLTVARGAPDVGVVPPAR